IQRWRDLGGTQLTASSTYAYDQLGRLTSLAHAGPAAVVATYSWTFDALNRVASLTSLDGTFSYTYDAVSQLTAVTGTGPEAYAYDLNGNRQNTGYASGPNNQLLSDGLYAYQYDDEGNRVRRTRLVDGAMTEYRWDHRNRLVGVTDRSPA